MTKHIPFTICWLWQLSAFPARSGAPNSSDVTEDELLVGRRDLASDIEPSRPLLTAWRRAFFSFFPTHVVWALILDATSNILGNPSPSAAALFGIPPPPHPHLLVYLNRQASRAGSRALFLPLLHSSKVHLTDLQIDPSDAPIEERPGLEQVYDGCLPSP